MTDQSIRVAAAGWYADPVDPARVRWWNGVGWTEHTAPAPGAEEPAASELVPAAPEPAHPPTRRDALAAEGVRAAPDEHHGATGVIWATALLPIVAFAVTTVALYVYVYVATSPLVGLVALAPSLLGVLWAVSDGRRLAARGMRAPSALWALLTPLAYLVVRRARVPGSGPLVLFLVTLALTVVVPTVFWVSGAARMASLAVDVQRTAVAKLVDSGELRSVHCPPVVESLTPGTLFTCQATATDGTPTQVWVSIDSADGSFSIAPAI